VRSAALSADGRIVAVTDDRGTSIWDVATGRRLQRLGGATGQIALSRDGALAVTTAYPKAARIWDVGRGRTVRVLRGSSDRALDAPGAAISPDGKVVAIADFGGATLWDVASGRTWHVPRRAKRVAYGCLEAYSCPHAAS